MGRVASRKTISGKLSVNGIDSIIKELRAYQANITSLNELFATKLAEIGIKEAYFRIAQTQGLDEDKDAGDVTFNLTGSGDLIDAYINFTGTEVLYIEFGSGITYNRGANPHASAFGYGAGTHSVAGHWNDPNGWIYRGEDDKLYHSYGTKATMPMLNAKIQICQQIANIAREVFQSAI